MEGQLIIALIQPKKLFLWFLDYHNAWVDVQKDTKKVLLFGGKILNLVVIMYVLCILECFSRTKKALSYIIEKVLDNIAFIYYTFNAN